VSHFRLLKDLILSYTRSSLRKRISTCVAFWGQLRLGEILSETADLSSSICFPSLSHLSPPNQNGSRTLHLPPTKMANVRSEIVMLCRQHGPSDPIAALDAHLLSNKIFLSDPFFRT